MNSKEEGTSAEIKTIRTSKFKGPGVGNELFGRTKYFKAFHRNKVPF